MTDGIAYPIEYHHIAGYFVGSVTIVTSVLSDISAFVAVPVALFFALLTQLAMQPGTEQEGHK